MKRNQVISSITRASRFLPAALPLLGLLPLACLSAKASTYLVTFGDQTAYTSDGTNTWQSFDLSTGSGSGSAGNFIPVLAQVLTDIGGSEAADITLSFTATAAANGKVGNQNEQVLASFFATNPYPWFSPASAEQRKTHSIDVGSGPFVLTLGGFSTDDTVDVDFVLGRSGTGDRAVTISRAGTGDVLDDGQVDEDPGPAYPRALGLSGVGSYAFTFTNTGATWACLPNALRVRVRSTGPVAAISAPAPGTLLYPDKLLIAEVDAQAPLGEMVHHVELFKDGVSIGTDSTAPFSFVLGYPNEGPLALRAIASVSGGLSATSEVHLTVAPLYDRIWTRHTIDNTLQGADGVRSADLDGDGDQDLIASWEESGTVRVYRNPGPSRAALTNGWPHMTFTQNLASVEDAHLADLDGDGRPDLIVATEGTNKKIVIFWAPAPGIDLWDPAGWTPMVLTPANGQEWMFTRVVDVNGDGRPDIVAGSKNNGGTVSWFAAPANSRVAAGWANHKITNAGWIMSLEVEDMDGDGDLDVLVTDRRPGGSAQALRWLEHPGTASPDLGSPWTSHTLAGLGDEVMFLDIADLDGDGLRDIAVPILEEGATPNDWLLLRRLDTSGLNWGTHRRTFPAGTGEAKALKAADINGDGVLDLAASFGDAIAPAQGAIWLRHDGNPFTGTWTSHPVSGPAGEKFDLILPLDIDGDGDPDLIQTDEDENKDSDGLGLFIYENPTRTDCDGDGATDREEFGMRSNPDDPASLLRLLAVGSGPSGGVEVVWYSNTSGSENPHPARYRLVYAADPTGPSGWTPLVSGIVATGEVSRILGPYPADRGIFRVEVE